MPFPSNRVKGYSYLKVQADIGLTFTQNCIFNPPGELTYCRDCATMSFSSGEQEEMEYREGTAMRLEGIISPNWKRNQNSIPDRVGLGATRLTLAAG